jgi:transcriptional regulator with XRE-family HTH domain
MTRMSHPIFLRMKQVRLERRMTQRQLAQRAGRPQADISRLERGRLIPTPDELVKFAKALRWTEDPQRLLDRMEPTFVPSETQTDAR